MDMLKLLSRILSMIAAISLCHFCGSFFEGTDFEEQMLCVILWFSICSADKEEA